MGEKAILYTYNAENEEVSINSDEFEQEKKFPSNKGIIGRCIKNGAFEIVDDVQKDKDYDATIDEMLNIQTMNLLCCPLKDFESGEVYGVIEAINKQKSNKFSNHDVDLLNVLGNIGQITLQNGIIYEIAAASEKKIASTLALWSHLNDESKLFNVNSLLFEITRRCMEITDAEKCTFYFVDHSSNELWSMQGDINIRMPIEQGMAGLCATSGEIVNEDNVYNNEQFNKLNDEKSGFVTKSMLCVPMKGNENKVIGLLQLINKQGVIGAFDSNDEQILTMLLSAASRIMEQNQLQFMPEHKRKSSPRNDERFVSDLKGRPPLEKRPSLLGVAPDIKEMVEEEPSKNEPEKKEQE